jgi:hypothetical protein
MTKKIKPQSVPAGIVTQLPPKIVFGFSQLKRLSYVDARNDSAFFIDYLSRLQKLSELDWNIVWKTQRHGLGTEMIPRSSLKVAAQNQIPEDMDKLIVFRATGNNHAFLGYRDGNIFQVLFIEYQFGDIYKH